MSQHETVPHSIFAIALAPLAIVILVFSMVFSTHSSANAAAAPNAARAPSAAEPSASARSAEPNHLLLFRQHAPQLLRRRRARRRAARAGSAATRLASLIARGASSTDAASGSIAAAAPTSRSRGPNWGGWDNGYNIYCASDNGGRNNCPTDTRGGVQLIRQRSGSPCDFGRTWGYDRRGIWVDRGCRADFQIGGGGGGGGGMEAAARIPAPARRSSLVRRTTGGATFARSRRTAAFASSASAATRIASSTRTWGYDRRGVWVDRGCRADFEVGRMR